MSPLSPHPPNCMRDLPSAIRTTHVISCRRVIRGCVASPRRFGGAFRCDRR
jgi:hypothetical protein